MKFDFLRRDIAHRRQQNLKQRRDVLDCSDWASPVRPLKLLERMLHKVVGSAIGSRRRKLERIPALPTSCREYSVEQQAPPQWQPNPSRI